MKKQLLILFTLCLSLIGYSQTVGDTFVENFITYEVTSVAPDTVKVIDYNMAGGTVVNIPVTITDNSITYNVTRIGISSFQNKGITGVTIPNSVDTIEESAFLNNQLTNVVIPNTVTTIEQYSFSDNLLTSVVISDGITIIEDGVFQNNQLTGVTIPNNVTVIRDQAFLNNQLTSIIIPNNVEYIKDSAFKNNQLTSVTIPDSVISMNEEVFFNNPLSDVYVLGTTPSIILTDSEDTFATDRSNIHLHIPAGTMGAYVTDTGALWTGFNPVTEDALSVTDFKLANTIKVITTKDEIQVVSPDSVMLKNYTIYNISGAKVTTGKETKITTTPFANGIYILKLDFSKGTVIKKVVIH